MSVIERIVGLQKIDSQLQDIAELLGDLPVKVDELKNEESALIKSVEDGKARIKELELEISKFDGQMMDIKEINLLENRVIGDRESHRLVLVAEPERARMSKIIGKL